MGEGVKKRFSKEHTNFLFILCMVYIQVYGMYSKMWKKMEIINVPVFIVLMSTQ